MSKINASIIINKPVDEVFTFVGDFEKDTQWWLGVIESKVISDIRPGVGTRYWQLSYFFGKRNETTFEITEYEPYRYIALQSLESAIPFVARYTLESVPEGTRFTMNAKVEWQGFYKILQPLFTFFMQRGANKFFKKLKSVLEEQPIVETK